MLVLEQIRDIEIEQSVLGSILTNEECFLIARDKKVKASMFYETKHQQLFKAIVNLVNSGFKIDTTTLISQNKENIMQLGGISYIAEIASSVASTAPFENWIKELYKYHQRRNLLEISNYIQQHISSDADSLKSNVQNRILKLYDEETLSLEEEIYRIIDQQDAIQQGISGGIKTGIRRLDENLGGFKKTELITLFARSGVGKTTLALQIALNMSKENNRILFVSNEMTSKEIYDKLFANYCSVNLHRVITGKLEAEEFAKYVSFMSKVAHDKKVRVIKEKNINTLISKIKLQKLKYGLDVVFIDYINLTLEGTEGDSMTYKIGDAMAKLKDIAMEEDICVIVLAQASKSIDKGATTKASYEKIEASDIQDSARIEQFSNIAISLYRNLILDNKVAQDELFREGKINYHSKDPDTNPKCASMTINKSRYGGKTTISLRWEPQYSRISNFEL